MVNGLTIVAPAGALKTRVLATPVSILVPPTARIALPICEPVATKLKLP